jgi:hypothetical protein
MHMRIFGAFCAVLLGLGLPAFIFGPVLFDGVALGSIPIWAVAVGFGSGLFGAWLLVVSAFAPLEDVEKVLEPLQAGEAVVLFLPYMLFFGTRSVWRSLVATASDRHEEL